MHFDKTNKPWIAAIILMAVAAISATLLFSHKSSDKTPSDLVSPTLSNTEPTIPFQPSAKSNYTSAWLTYWDDGTGLASFKANAKKLTEVHPFWLEAQSPTKIVTQGNASFRQQVLQTAKANNVKVVPTITETMKTDAFIAMATNNQTLEQHSQAICKLVKDNDYAGIDIDYENFALKVNADTVDQAKTSFTAVIKSVAKCLHEDHKTLEVTVLPKTDDSVFAPYLGSIAPGVFDYKAIGAVADIVRPMAYDHTTPLTQPGSTDPIGWVRAVGDYARRYVPAKKVVLAVPLYGYDWNASGGKPLTARQVANLVKSTNSTVQYNDIAKTRTFEYKAADGTHHEVWYDTTVDTQQRVALAKELKLAGVTYWAIGSEDRDFWTTPTK